eukprot:COSAG01_NODE_9997_length_2279_cov_1.643283_2_plen_394_part_00
MLSNGDFTGTAADGSPTWQLLGGEQGTILPRARKAVASCCAGPAAVWWKQYYELTKGPGNSQAVVWIENIDKNPHLDWFGHWADCVWRCAVLGQNLQAFCWPEDEIRKQYGDTNATGPFVDTIEEALQAAALQAQRLRNDPTHTMTVTDLSAEQLTVTGRALGVFPALTVGQSPEGAIAGPTIGERQFLNPLCWGFAQLQEMKYLLETFPAAQIQIRRVDSIVENEGSAVGGFVFMEEVLEKKGGGLKPKFKTKTIDGALVKVAVGKYKKRSFALGVDSLAFTSGAKYKGATKTISLGAGSSVMVGRGEERSEERDASWQPTGTEQEWERPYLPNNFHDPSKTPRDITIVDTHGRKWELRASSETRANNWGIAIEKYTPCTAVGKHPVTHRWA